MQAVSAASLLPQSPHECAHLPGHQPSHLTISLTPESLSETQDEKVQFLSSSGIQLRQEV